MHASYTSLQHKTHCIIIVLNFLFRHVFCVHVSNIHIHICILPIFNYTTPVVYTNELPAHDRQLYYSIDICNYR